VGNKSEHPDSKNVREGIHFVAGSAGEKKRGQKKAPLGIPKKNHLLLQNSQLMPKKNTKGREEKRKFN